MAGEGQSGNREPGHFGGVPPAGSVPRSTTPTGPPLILLRPSPDRSFGRHKAAVIVVCVVAAGALVAAILWKSKPNFESLVGDEPPELVVAREIVTAAQIFRRLAQVSYQDALEQLVPADAALRERRQLEAVLGKQEQAEAFFSDAYIIAADLEGQGCRIGYHHPWTGLLLTAALDHRAARFTDFQWHSASRSLLGSDLFAENFPEAARSASEQAQAALLNTLPATAEGPGDTEDLRERIEQYEFIRAWSGGATTDPAVPPLLDAIDDFLVSIMGKGIRAVAVPIAGGAGARDSLASWLEEARKGRANPAFGPIYMQRRGGDVHAALLVAEQDPSIVLLLGLDSTNDQARVTRVGWLDFRIE